MVFGDIWGIMLWDDLSFWDFVGGSWKEGCLFWIFCVCW